MSDEQTVHAYIDEEIYAATVDELRQKAADLAEAAWVRELEFRAELADRPHRVLYYDPLAVARTTELWAEKLSQEVSKRHLF